MIRHKSYGDLQSLTIIIYEWKNLFIDFVTRLLISTNWKEKNYNLILVIIDRLIKIIHYQPVNVINTALVLAEIMIDMIV